MKNDRSGAVSQAINGCAVHNSGQVCLFQGKNGRDCRAITNTRNHRRHPEFYRLWSELHHSPQELDKDWLKRYI
jgi:hypothetical protein